MWTPFKAKSWNRHNKPSSRRLSTILSFWRAFTCVSRLMLAAFHWTRKSPESGSDCGIPLNQSGHTDTHFEWFPFLRTAQAFYSVCHTLSAISFHWLGHIRFHIGNFFLTQTEQSQFLLARFPFTFFRSQSKVRTVIFRLALPEEIIFKFYYYQPECVSVCVCDCWMCQRCSAARQWTSPFYGHCLIIFKSKSNFPCIERHRTENVNANANGTNCFYFRSRCCQNVDRERFYYFAYCSRL